MATGPIITLTTDFGLTDFYVAAMKAVLIKHAPGATLIDITHRIHRHDLRSASFTLERAITAFPRGTIHLAVVDPGVGTQRRLMVANLNDSVVVCPDNGLITWPWRLHPDATAHELTWRPDCSSNTFHGRDVMAPVAGQLAAGVPIKNFTGSLITPALLDMDLSTATVGKVIHIDHFGNATTNIPARLVTRAAEVEINGNHVPIHRTYADVEIGQPLALIGSSDLLEIAIRNGSAAETLNIRNGDTITLF